MALKKIKAHLANCQCGYHTLIPAEHSGKCPICSKRMQLQPEREYPDDEDGQSKYWICDKCGARHLKPWVIKTKRPQYPDDEFRRNWKPEHPEYVILWVLGAFLFGLLILSWIGFYVYRILWG